MIENMRKYTGLMVVVFILLGAGFLFTMNDIGGGKPSIGGGKPVMEAYGQSIDEYAYHRMGQRTQQLALELGLIYYINFLSSTGQPSDFIVNRLTLQRAMEEMGLYASDEQVTEALKNMPKFTPGGSYDPSLYSSFVDKRLGVMGMTEKDMVEVVRESLCLNKLIDIVGGGLIAPRTAVRDQVEARGQIVTLVRAVLKRDDFVEKEDPTEEEIKQYWEENKDAFKTDELRRISYILLDVPAETAEDKKEDKPETAGVTKRTQAEKDKEEADKKEAEAKAQKEKADKKKLASLKVRREVDTISDILAQRYNDKLPPNLEELLKERDHALVNTELFSKVTAPAELKDLMLRGVNNRGKFLLDSIFSQSMGSDPFDRISDTLPVGEHAWIIFRLEEVVEPKLLEYEDARGEARAKLVSENGTRKVKEAAEEARKKILAAMKEGKSFDDAAKAVNLTPVQVGPFSMNGIPPKNEPSYRELHQAASGLNPGDVSEAIHENDRSLVIYVDKREIEDTELLGKMTEFEATRTDGQLRFIAFNEWLTKQREKADVKILFKEK